MVSFKSSFNAIQTAQTSPLNEFVENKPNTHLSEKKIVGRKVVRRGFRFVL